MAGNQYPVDADLFDKNKPELENIADSIMENIKDIPAEELSHIMGISRKLAITAVKYAYDFPNKTTGYTTLEGFTGEAYRSLDVKSLNNTALQNINPQLRIISSAYGLLKPSDIIKPYRLEYNKPLGPSNNTPIKIFKPKVTVELVKYLKDQNIKEIIDLLPADADSCVDWKIVRAFAKVHKICFYTMNNDGTTKTPIASKLKSMRGLMARNILENNISSFEELTGFESDNYVYSAADSKPGLPVFIC